MEQKYRVLGPSGVIPHIEGKLCKCGRILPLSHQGPCPDCGNTVLEEAVIPNAADITELKKQESSRIPIIPEDVMGGTD